MDLGDFIFIFIMVLVIIGRVLSWLLKQFLPEAPDDKEAPSKQPGIMDHLAEWIRSFEETISPVTPETNQWERFDSREYHSESNERKYHVESDEDDEIIQRSQPILSEAQLYQTEPQRHHIPTVQAGHHLRSKQFNLKNAIIHHEILSPPLALRQENL